MVNAATKNGSSNGVHAEAATITEHDLLWTGLPPSIIKELEKPLDPSWCPSAKAAPGAPTHT